MLPFGSRTNPGSFCVASEMVMNSSQDLLEDDTWDSDTLSSRWKTFIPKTQVNSNTSFPKPFPLSVEVEFNKNSVDGYVDDIMVVALQLPDCINRI